MNILPALSTFPLKGSFISTLMGQEDPLEEGMATLFRILAWRTPWTEELGGLQFIGSHRLGQGYGFSSDHVWM